MESLPYRKHGTLIRVLLPSVFLPLLGMFIRRTCNLLCYPKYCTVLQACGVVCMIMCLFLVLLSLLCIGV